MTDSQQSFIEKMEDQIREWTGRIAELKSKADQAPATEKIGMLNQIADLNRRKEQLMARVQELKQVEGDSWDQIREAVQSEASDLDEAYREAIRYFH